MGQQMTECQILFGMQDSKMSLIKDIHMNSILNGKKWNLEKKLKNYWKRN